MFIGRTPHQWLLAGPTAALRAGGPRATPVHEDKLPWGHGSLNNAFTVYGAGVTGNGSVMSNQRRKAAIRAYMAEHDVNYTTAMRRLDHNQPSCSLVAALRQQTGVMCICGPKRSAKWRTAQTIADELQVLGRRVLVRSGGTPTDIDPADWDVVVVDDLRPTDADADDADALVAAAEDGEILLIKVSKGNMGLDLPAETGWQWTPVFAATHSLQLASGLFDDLSRPVTDWVVGGLGQGKSAAPVFRHEATGEPHAFTFETLVASPARTLDVYGGPGAGKTALASALAEHWPGPHDYLWVGAPGAQDLPLFPARLNFRNVGVLTEAETRVWETGDGTLHVDHGRLRPAGLRDGSEKRGGYPDAGVVVNYAQLPGETSRGSAGWTLILDLRPLAELTQAVRVSGAKDPDRLIELLGRRVRQAQGQPTRPPVGVLVSPTGDWDFVVLPLAQRAPWPTHAQAGAATTGSSGHAPSSD